MGSPFHLISLCIFCSFSIRVIETCLKTFEQNHHPSKCLLQSSALVVKRMRIYSNWPALTLDFYFGNTKFQLSNPKHQNLWTDPKNNEHHLLKYYSEYVIRIQMHQNSKNKKTMYTEKSRIMLVVV